MESQQVRALQESLATVLPAQDTVAARFREHLVTLDPFSRPLFAGAGFARQGVLLINAVALCAGLRPADFSKERVASALLQYHVNHAIKAKEFQTAARALALALRDELGGTMSEDMIDAWAAACRLLGETLRTAYDPLAA